jgi:hypothetical protein
MIEMKSLGLPEQILNSLWHHFPVLILKQRGFAVSHLTVTLQTMIDSRRLISLMNPVHVRLIFQ